MANVLAKRASRLLSGTRRIVSKRLFFAPDRHRDIYLASFPRSGNTWIRAIIYTLLNGEPPASLGAINELVPDAYLLLPKREVVPRPFYVVKTHEPYRTGGPKRAIYVLREPKAVFRSHYGYLKLNWIRDVELTRLAGDWTTGRVWPGSWNEHVTSWLVSNSHAEVLLIQYDELKSAPVNGIRAMAAFIGAPVSAERAEAISGLTTIADMKRLEESGVGRHSDKRFIATGVGELPPEVSELIDVACGGVWSKFGGRGAHSVVSHPDGSRRVFSAAEGAFVPL
ncbi:MAG: sulfotransferase domain-containing protein [Bauldia sp.]|nr:sulfotransferase domain-containing protein [Bauldia sp.]